MERRERGREEEVEEPEGIRGVDEVLEVETVREARRGAVIALLVGSLRGDGLRVPGAEGGRVLVMGARTGRVVGRETTLAGREVLATRVREGAREGGLEGVGDW